MTPVPVLGNPQGAGLQREAGQYVRTQAHIYTKTPSFDVDPKEDADVAEAASQLGLEY